MTAASAQVASAEDVGWFTVDHPSATGGVRRAAVALATRLGFGESRAAQIALVVSELAGNQVKHAGSGAVLLRARRAGEHAAVEVLATDSGPGMRDVRAAMRDGMSTSGTLGIGLGTLPRLASAWDVWSSPGQGTVIAATFADDDADLSWTRGPAGITRAMTGQTMCGDAIALRSDDGIVTVMLADGLGHGPLAATAALEAVRAFREAHVAAPGRLLETVHRALAGTRGAAVTIARPDGAQVRVAGLGNVAGFQRGPRGRRGLLSHPGIAGSGAPSFRETTYPAERPGLLVLHSDGLTDRIDLDRYPGLLERTPLVVAGVILRDYGVRRDDASVVVVPLDEGLEEGPLHEARPDGGPGTRRYS